MTTRNDLIASMNKREKTISVGMLQHWAREGLIDDPDVDQQGGKVGGVATYPPGTEERVEIIWDALEKKKDLLYARWELWQRGFLVDPIPVLRRSLDRMVSFQESLRSGPIEGLSQETRDEIVAYGEKRNIPPLLKTARKRIGKKGFPGFLLLLVESHVEADLVEDEADQVIFNAGFSPFLGKQITNNVYSILDGIRPHLDPDKLDSMLSEITSEELRIAYDELIEITAFAFEIHTQVRVSSGKKKPPMRVLTRFAEHLPTMLLVWSSMRRDAKLYSSYLTIKKAVAKLMANAKDEE